ncbi:MAG TPA: DUF4240 domain-containing protein [Amycolatopsis sp.]|uniref:DUF4240 domain-containing protein n=1 Tax=Amycolatopsis sp. TaxID=37632 RepID=UPI002B4979FA|nr:DUF4240 domain-containing protein [Amycolatopsis sp.]HKS48330.1 DUF4240 domain-containing protein [Amycolatopsis sp.]
MDTEEFWRVLDTAKGSDQPLDVAVAAYLATRPEEEILAFEYRFDQLRRAVHRWDVWAAACLIGEGCSDDRFGDFTAGLVALGRDWYERAAASADALADHPAVRAAVAGSDDDAIFYEDFGFAAVRAFGDEDDFWEAWESYRAERAAAPEPGGDDMGESFDVDDPEEVRERLPRLADLYLADRTPAA